MILENINTDTILDISLFDLSINMQKYIEKYIRKDNEEDLRSLITYLHDNIDNELIVNRCALILYCSYFKIDTIINLLDKRIIDTVYQQFIIFAWKSFGFQAELTTEICVFTDIPVQSEIPVQPEIEITVRYIHMSNHDRFRKNDLRHHQIINTENKYNIVGLPYDYKDLCYKSLNTT